MDLTRILIRGAAAGAAALTFAAPGAMAQGTPDHVSSDNVELIGSFKQAGDGVGARIVGNTMFVTSTTHITVFDVTDAENPKQLGNLTADVEWENEDVPTNGKILGISASIATPGACDSPTAIDCLKLYDVSDPANLKFIKAVDGAGNHTQECVLDCTWFYGSEGTIVDARDPANAKVVENKWTTLIQDAGYDINGPHDVTEVAPGIIVTSSNPIYLLSARPEHGGSPDTPVVLAAGDPGDNRFIHSATWPRKGTDRWLLMGGETVLGPAGGGGPCGDDKAAFMTWDASAVRDGKGGWNRGASWLLTDEKRPYNGNYVDGGHPVDAFGCSVHWFQEHPAFRNGGLVAVSAYEHGTRLYQITPEGKIVEQGYALPIAGAASAPHWHPNGKVFYTIDYQRGVDVWRWNGETYQGPADAGQASAGGGGGASGGGSSSAGAPSEVLRLSVTPRRTRLKAFLRKGMTVRVGCSRACSLTATAKAGRRTVGRARKRGATRTTLRIKPSKSVARKLRRAKRLTLKLSVVAKAADGRGATSVRTIRLR